MTRVLFAYDGSAPARRALEYASRLDTGGEAAVISVAPALIEAPRTAKFTDPTHDEQRAASDAEEACRLLEAAGVRGEAIVATGNPAAEIIRAAEERGIELIVVGGHGRHGVERFLVGSVAERIVRHARCDVLVAR